ncbi:MAG TPA: hypothetical protein VLT47_10820 [Anaeromyxobacteraceae bacterium]|nr:hypothetical protein [Anaeromyxobacteraceae bacterium]
MTPLARVDALRALPAPIALGVLRQLEAEMGPEAVGALETAWEFWRRPVQRFPTDAELRRYHTVIYTGDFGAGKTRCAWELLLHLILTRRARSSRIVAANGAAAREIVTDDDTGILAWRKPGVVYDYQSSQGYEGELRVNGTLISLCSIEAPKSLTGSGRSAELLDDPPKWGPTGKAALVNAMRSTRQPGAITIIPTTADGLQLIADVNGVHIDGLDAVGVLTIHLGRTEDNPNLDPKILIKRANLKRAGLWDAAVSTSPWADVLAPERWAARRLAVCPPLVELAVAVDPAKGGSSRPCEVGIMGGGRDATDVLHVRYDRSGILDGGAEGWPKVAWDLAEELHGRHPGAPFPPFIFESNVGKAYGDLLYAEERNRRKSRGEPGVNARCKVIFVRADADKCVRAEGPARVAAQGQVRFAPDLGELEGQLRNLTPKGIDSDRADAANHLLTHLGRLGEGAEQVEAQNVQALAAASVETAAALTATVAAIPRAAPGLPFGLGGFRGVASRRAL